MSNNYNFGVEIEFTNIKLDRVSEKLDDTSILFEYLTQHKLYGVSYDRWFLDGDGSVSNIIDGKIVGGELSSRILNDSEDSWEEVKNICLLLKELGGESSDRCSTHVTVDISKHINDSNFFEVLSKVIAVYETDIDLFFMGDSYLLRRTKGDYAKDMSIRLLNNLDKVAFSDNYLSELFLNTLSFKDTDGINLYKLRDFGLMEVRYPNGTLNDETIKNYVTFILRLINSIEEDRFDLDYLDYMIDKDKNDKFRQLKIYNHIEDIDRFYDLLDTISNDFTDEDNFSRQYEKVISTR